MCMGASWVSRARAISHRPLVSCRALSTHHALLSGHNRWSKIKHEKGKEDALKSKARTLLSQEIILASKYGGPDPSLNSRLAIAITSAKKGQLSKTSIESAIARGQGKSTSGLPLETVTIEALLPFGVAAMIECQTESKARVLQDIRYIIGRAGGTVTPTAFLFDKRGKIWFLPRKGMGVDEAMEEAIDAGATDILEEDGRLVVETSPADVTIVAQRLQDRLQLQVERSEITYVPKEESAITLTDLEGSELQNVLDSIEEEQSLQNLYINAVPQQV